VRVADAAADVRRLIAGVYSRAAPTYDRFASSYFAHYAERLAELVTPRPDAAVLDVACGTGAIARAFAPRVPAGSVVACDLAAGMVAAARDETQSAGGSSAVQVAVMDAENLGFVRDSFDVAACAFALHIIPNPSQSLVEITRATRADGVFACSLWGDDDPRWEWESELFASLGARTRLQSHDLSSADKVSALLGVHWADVQVETEDYDATLRDEQEWWDWKWSYGIRLALEQIDAETLARLKDAAFARMQPQRDPSGFPLRLRALLATARNAR
jgi:SAM-dependent methyltransferase